jgi:transposase
LSGEGVHLFLRVDTMMAKREFEATAAVRRHGVRYRKHSLESKRAIAQQCLVPRTSVAGVALANGVNANLVRKWIHKYRSGEYGEIGSSIALLPVTIRDAPATVATGPSVPPAQGHIDIELPSGHIRVHGRVDVETLRAVLTALAR